MVLRQGKGWDEMTNDEIPKYEGMTKSEGPNATGVRKWCGADHTTSFVFLHPRGHKDEQKMNKLKINR